MAAQYGYPAIECDVKYTLDSVMVIMHDGTINRTMRNASDYSVIEEPVRVTEHTFEDLRTNYVLASTDPFLRVPIPTLKEELEACREYGIVPMLHSAVVESYELAHEILGDKFIAFDASQAAVAHARDFSQCLILSFMGDISSTVLAGHSTSPATDDWNGDGKDDILLGAEDGHFYLVRNPN